MNVQIKRFFLKRYLPFYVYLLCIKVTLYCTIKRHAVLVAPTRRACVFLQDMLRLEAEVKNLHAAVDQIQVTLASPDLNRLSLREQLTQRQVTHN